MSQERSTGGSPGIKGRVALVTAAAGIGPGQEIARRLASEGARVVVTDVNVARTQRVADAVAKDFPDTVVVGYALDAADRTGIDAVIEEVNRTLGPITILVNNAAVNISRTMTQCSTDAWDRTLAVNLSGPWYLCRQTLTQMAKAGGGVIVNISSYAADVGIEGPYAVSKGGLNALTRVCAVEGAPFGIRAVAVSTGYIADTKWALEHPEQQDVNGVKSALGSYAVSAEVAEMVVFLVSDHAAHVTGEIVNIGAGAYMRN